MFSVWLILSIFAVYFVLTLDNNKNDFCSIKFGKPITKEEYRKRQDDLTKDVIETLNIDKKSYSKNINYFENKKCPYCEEKIENKKSTSFLCPVCKNKIYRKNHFINKKTLYLTEQDVNLFIEEREKYSKYRQFCGLCRKLNQTGLIYVNEKDIQGTITKLHFGKKSFYNKNSFFDLRICRYYEGMVQEIYGTKEQATNAYMSVLYLDLFGNYNILDKKWDCGTVFPNSYDTAFQENLSIEKFEEIFINNANSLIEVLQFTPPITPQEAWEKILEYKKSLN